MIVAFHAFILLLWCVVTQLLGVQGWVTHIKHNRGHFSYYYYSTTALFAQKLLIVGMGRSGKCIAQLAAPHFNVIVGTTTTAQTLPETVQCIHPQELWHACRDSEYTTFQDCSHILITIPGTATMMTLQQNATDEKVTMEHFYNALVESWIATTSTSKSSLWLGIFSTTAVYGNHHGQWVTEESDCLGSNEWREYEASWKMRFPNVQIFRCAGIYGNTRSALHTVYRSGTIQQATTAKQNESDSTIQQSSNSNDTPMMTHRPRPIVTNRIHEEDLARAIVASMILLLPHSNNMEDDGEAPSTADKNFHNVYNLADDCPEARRVVMRYAAQLLLDTMTDEQLLEKDLSQQEHDSDTSSKNNTSKRSQRRGKDHKLVDNSKMKQHLLKGKPLLYPTYKEGLDSILLQPGSPWNG